MDFGPLSTEQVEVELQTNRATGLLQEEGKKRLKQIGSNQLVETKKKSRISLFLGQFKDFMVLVLIGATILSAVLGEYVDAISVISIVLLNGILGFIQEHKAEKSLAALKAFATPQMMVLRESVWTKIPAEEVVPGDVVKFVQGDRIGADLKVTACTSLFVEESPLTGESLPVEKSVKNLVFMGTLVTSGFGEGIVVATGMNTAMGQVAHMITTTEQVNTPLQKRLAQLGKVLILLSLLLTAGVVLLGMYQGQGLYHMLLSGASLAVAVIPEGLPAIVTVALSLGVERMLKKKALVKKLPAVETLGCTTVICSDKTGTLTENKMVVKEIWGAGQKWTVTGEGYESVGDFYEGEKVIQADKVPHLYQMLTFASLCSHATIDAGILDGDPTEGALVACSQKAGVTRDKLQEQFHLIKEIPFGATRKMMSVLYQGKDEKSFVITKGAPDILLSKCERILWDDKLQAMSRTYEEKVTKQIEGFASASYRTIAVAYKLSGGGTEVEAGLTFIGLFAIIDPPRKGVKEAIETYKKAGIKTVMITGDHKLTAVAIAKELGIMQPGDEVIEGREIEGLQEKVEKITVYARVTPADKLKIVQALQQKGHIVAMTGDGVNDAPALKVADTGIAMGNSGTDVAKEAADLVLIDDNFTTIGKAIEEGRNIYENIRKFIRYLLASNVGEILVMFFAMMLKMPLPLLPIQILWVNLVTDGLPALALGLDKPEANVMKDPPRNGKEGIFARGLGWKVISRGLLIGGVTLLAFIITLEGEIENLSYAQTVALATLVLAQLILVFDCRSEKTIFHRNPFGNPALIGAVLVSLGLLLVVIYYPPLATLFETAPIVKRDWILITALSSIPTFLLMGGVFSRKK